MASIIRQHGSAFGANIFALRDRMNAARLFDPDVGWKMWCAAVSLKITISPFVRNSSH